MSLRKLVQVVLTRIGTLCSRSHIQILNAALNYLEVGRWLKANGFESSPRYASREQLYSAIAAAIENEVVLYLEFGVYEGYSMRTWVKLLKNPHSSLHGFDSFEGLPEEWDKNRPKGYFSVEGNLPQIDDQRVVFHKGWFDETLPTFVLPEHQRLVLNLDADLYQSTRIVLDLLEQKIAIGTILIFDEFCDRLHELRAFDEFIQRSGMGFRFIGGSRNLEQAAFERISTDPASM